MALVASTASQTDSSGTTSSAIDTTGADFLALIVISYFGASEPTISDSKGNTWTGRTAYDDGTTRTRIYYASNPTVGSGHTFTASGASSYAALAVQAHSGIATTSPYESENGASSPFLGSNSLATGSVTPSADGALLVAGWGLGVAGTPDSPSVNNGFTIANSAVNIYATSFGIASTYLYQGTAGAINPTLSWTTGSGVSAAIAVFTAAEVGGLAIPIAAYHYNHHLGSMG